MAMYPAPILVLSESPRGLHTVPRVTRSLSTQTRARSASRGGRRNSETYRRPRSVAIGGSVDAVSAHLGVFLPADHC